MEQLPCLKRLEVWKWSILALQVKLWKGLNLHFACKMEPGVPLLQHVQVSLVHFSQHCSVATHLYCVVYLWCLHFFKLIYFLSPDVPLPNVTARRTIWNGGDSPYVTLYLLQWAVDEQRWLRHLYFMHALGHVHANWNLQWHSCIVGELCGRLLHVLYCKVCNFCLSRNSQDSAKFTKVQLYEMFFSTRIYDTLMCIVT